MPTDRGQLYAAGTGYDALPGPALVIGPLPGASPGTLAGAVVYCVISMRPGALAR